MLTFEPTGALLGDPERPVLRFTEDACVQCGLCKATCPEKVVTLEPRVGFKAFEDGPVVLKQEEPFCCISCGNDFCMSPGRLQDDVGQALYLCGG